MSDRSDITNALVTLLKTSLNGVTKTSNVFNNVKNKLIFWDEINTFPYIGVVAGSETREYLPGGFKWGFLNVSIKINIKQENPQQVLEQYLEDIEALLDANNDLTYSGSKQIEQISILSVETDMGLLDPIGVGEMTIQIRYDKA